MEILVVFVTYVNQSFHSNVDDRLEFFEAHRQRIPYTFLSLFLQTIYSNWIPSESKLASRRPPLHLRDDHHLTTPAHVFRSATEEHRSLPFYRQRLQKTCTTPVLQYPFGRTYTCLHRFQLHGPSHLVPSNLHMHRFLLKTKMGALIFINISIYHHPREQGLLYHINENGRRE